MWYYTNTKSHKPDAIIGISDTGMLLLYNGSIRESNYRDTINVKGKRIRIYKIIADNFLQTVRRPEQLEIDHVTHKPVGMNINDVRNLRWCTHRENMGFIEHRTNLSNAKKGRPAWNKGHRHTEESKKKMSISLKGKPAWNKGLKGEAYKSHFNKYNKEV